MLCTREIFARLEMIRDFAALSFLFCLLARLFRLGVQRLLLFHGLRAAVTGLLLTLRDLVFVRISQLPQLPHQASWTVD